MTTHTDVKLLFKPGTMEDARAFPILEFGYGDALHLGIGWFCGRAEHGLIWGRATLEYETDRIRIWGGDVQYTVTELYLENERQYAAFEEGEWYLEAYMEPRFQIASEATRAAARALRDANQRRVA